MPSSKQLLMGILSNAGCPEATQVTGSGPLNHGFVAEQGLVIRTLTLHLVGTPGDNDEDLVIKHKIPGLSPAFDTVRFQNDMDGISDVVLTDPIFLSKGDILTVEFANSDNIQFGLNFIHGSN